MTSTINASTTAGIVTTADTSGVLALQTAGTTAISINASQAVTMAGRTSNPTTISVGGATPSTSGAGITFPATQSASSDANTLDDYEEGTFTPSVTFGGGSTGITYDAVRRIGTYTRIGNKVFYFIHIQLTSKGSSTGAALITGLPFTAAGTDAFVPASIFISGMALITGQIMPRSVTGSTTIDIYQVVSSSFSGITDTNFTNTTGIQVSGMYSA